MVLNASVVTTAFVQAETPAPSSTSDALAEIIVIAQKRAENLQDVPIAITAVTRDQLQAANLVTANDLPTLVSGLSIGDTALYFQPHLRGIGTAAFGPGVENPVALYVAHGSCRCLANIRLEGPSRDPLWSKLHERRYSDDHKGSATEFWRRSPDFPR
jgi:iron complex outermembrane receptor protein